MYRYEEGRGRGRGQRSARVRRCRFVRGTLRAERAGGVHRGAYGHRVGSRGCGRAGSGLGLRSGGGQVH